MPFRLKETIEIDTTASTISVRELSLAVPDGKVVRVDSIAFYPTVKTAGTHPPMMMCGVLAKSTSMTAVTPTALTTAPEVIGFASLMSPGNAAVGIYRDSEVFLNMNPDPESLSPILFIGTDAVVVGGSTIECLVSVDYSVVNLTLDVSRKLAAR